MEIVEIADIYSPKILRLQNDNAGTEYHYLFREPDLEATRAMIAKDERNGPVIMRQHRYEYTMGILERCHLTCMTSLSRGERWLSGAIIAAGQQNLLSFTGSLRGLLESSADAHDVLRYLPDALKGSFRYSYLVLNNSLDIENMLVGFGPLEERLIHYVYAQKQPRGVPALEHHHAKTNADYIQALETFDVPNARALYAELCQYTHPAAPTVSCFLDETSSSLTLNFSKDECLIVDLLSRYQDTIERLIMYSFNPALMGLATLAKLVPHWHGPSDASLSTVGTCEQVLKGFDRFISTYVPGSLTREDLLAEIQRKH